MRKAAAISGASGPSIPWVRPSLTLHGELVTISARLFAGTPAGNANDAVTGAVAATLVEVSPFLLPQASPLRQHNPTNIIVRMPEP